MRDRKKERKKREREEGRGVKMGLRSHRTIFLNIPFIDPGLSSMVETYRTWDSFWTVYALLVPMKRTLNDGGAFEKKLTEERHGKCSELL